MGPGAWQEEEQLWESVARLLLHCWVAPKVINSVNKELKLAGTQTCTNILPP